MQHILSRNRVEAHSIRSGQPDDTLRDREDSAAHLAKGAAFDADLLTITMYSAFVSLALAMIYAIARIGFENPITPIASALGVALLVLCAPVTIRYWLASPDRHWLTSAPVLMILTVVSLALIGLLPLFDSSKQSLPLLSYLLAAVGGVLFVFTLARWWGGGRVIANLLLMLVAGLMAAWAGSLVWTGLYSSPLIIERVAFVPMIGDQMLNGALMGMLETYGTASTGFHGLIPLHYHVGSHMLFMALARLLGAMPLHFYQLGFQIIMVPVFLWSLLCAMLSIRTTYLMPLTPRPVRSDALLWGLFTLLHVGFSEQIPIADQTLIYHSESFMLGISLLALTIGLCAHVISRPVIQMRQFNSWQICAFVLIALPLLSAAMGLSKISIIYAFVAICGYFFIRWGLFRHWLFVVGMLLQLAVFISVYNLVNITPYGHPIYDRPFQNIINNYPRMIWPFYYVMYYAYSWVFIVLKLALKGPRTLRDLWQQFTNNELVDIELVAIIAVASALPAIGGLLFGEFWFALIQRWISLIFLVANVPLFVRFLSLRRAGESLGSISVRNVFVALVLAICLLAVPFQLTYPMIQFAKDNQYTRQYYTSQDREVYIFRTLRSTLGSGDLAGAVAVMRDVVIPFMTTHYQYTDRDPRYRLLHELERIGRLPTSEKRGALIFIPKSNAGYWDIPMTCDALPMLAPSITSMPMLQGIPPASCEMTTYAYMDYGVVERHDFAASDEAGICAEAESLGFSEVWVIDDASTHEIDCGS
jgi:hypothetical protein